MTKKSGIFNNFLSTAKVFGNTLIDFRLKCSIKVLQLQDTGRKKEPYLQALQVLRNTFSNTSMDRLTFRDHKYCATLLTIPPGIVNPKKQYFYKSIPKKVLCNNIALATLVDTTNQKCVTAKNRYCLLGQPSSAYLLRDIYDLEQCCGSPWVLIPMRIWIQVPIFLRLDPDPDPGGKK